MSETTANPNAILGTAIEHTAVQPSDASIADKMSAMLAQRDAGRKQESVAEDTAPGTTAEAKAVEPVAPDDSQAIVEPEDSTTEVEELDSTEDSEAPAEVSSPEADSTADELIDFLEFTETNPKAKFKFMRNGKEVIIDAKKAAAILGQGSAIHEEARELKIQKAEFEEFQKAKADELNGLTLAMTYTVQPQLKQAYNEIARVQGYQATFRQQLAQTTDYAERAEIEASMQQNEAYLQTYRDIVRELQPNVNRFKEHHSQQVAQLLEQSRKQFKDKELKNSYVFNELREKIGHNWEHAKTQLVPGVDTLDLITSDEHILSLLRDGLRYRDKPKTTSAGASIAALTSKKGSTVTQPPKKDEIAELRDRANKGDQKAAQNLLQARMDQIRAGRR